MSKSDLAKLVISIVIDLLDFTVGRMFGFGLLFDAMSVAIAVYFWGPTGLFALWELADPSEQVDGFVPTLTLIALSQLGRNKEKSAPRKREADKLKA